MFIEIEILLMMSTYFKYKNKQTLSVDRLAAYAKRKSSFDVTLFLTTPYQTKQNQKDTIKVA